jgi:hypothetical protein
VDILKTLYIDVEPDDFAEVRAKREEALRVGILLTGDADYVDATLRYDGEEIPAELRLKGDWMDHYAFDKWSFRVETRDDHYLLGMSAFSVQDLPRRAYLNEWLYLENLRHEGVLGVRYDFAHVVLNGEYLGIYALEEVFTKELLEFQERRESVIVRYAEDLVWEYRAAYENDEVIPPGVNQFHLIDEFDSGRVGADPTLSAQRDAAVGLLRSVDRGERPASGVFDVEAMAKFLALTDLWDARHAVIWHNLRYYYNPITARLEPIAFDAHPLSEGADVAAYDLAGLALAQVYDDPRLLSAYAHHLWRFSQPEYLDGVRELYEGEFEALRGAMEPEFGEEVLAPPWETLNLRQRYLREFLTPHRMAYAYFGEEVGDGLALEVGNLLPFPVEVVSLLVGGDVLPARADWAVPEAEGVVGEDGALVLAALAPDAARLLYQALAIPELPPSSELGEVRLVTRIWGMTHTYTQAVVPSYPPPVPEGPLPPAPTVEEVLEAHPFLTVDDEALAVRSGVHEVEGDLVLPEGLALHAGPGTTLRFGEDNFLLARGPLRFEGGGDEPVVLEPGGEVWRGVLVLEAGAPSLWRHVVVQDTDVLNRDGWILTGAITFYRSPIRLDRARLLGTRAEDLINVFRANFEFVDSEFAHTASDAFDGDFTEGLIEGCSFHDVAADAIDVSGSEVTVRDVHLVDLGDKALSAGEASRVTLEGAVVRNADFGLASKDASHVEASGVTLEGIRLAGLAAYVKKPAYGPASMVARGVTFVDLPVGQRTLVQTGCWIELEGARVWGTDVDVDALYEKWKK